MDGASVLRAKGFGFGRMERPIEFAMPEDGERVRIRRSDPRFRCQPDIRTASTVIRAGEPGWREAGSGTGLRSCARARGFGFGMTERPGLLDPFQDLLVLDLEFGITLSLFADHLAEGVVLT
jgi:hypothetical protein